MWYMVISHFKVTFNGIVKPSAINFLFRETNKVPPIIIHKDLATDVHAVVHSNTYHVLLISSSKSQT